MLPKGCPAGLIRIKGKCLTPMQAQRFIHKLTKEKWYPVVNTPNPYVIEYDNKTSNLDLNVRKLWDFIEKLGISEAEAVKREYSLDNRTLEQLQDLAWQKSNRDVFNEIAKLRSKL